jgi:hypothetical protein
VRHRCRLGPQAELGESDAKLVPMREALADD